MKTVLLADDETDLLETLRMVLEDEGYRVETCEDGATCLEKLRSLRPDVAIVDVMMPRLSGLEVLKAARADDGLKQQRFVLVSAVRPRVAQADYRWDAFLQKPFRLDALVEVLKQLTG